MRIKIYFYEFYKWGMVMDNPLVGKGIWKKVYKGEILIAQDDSGEIRKTRKVKKQNWRKKRK